jgi:hypothetical protein
VIIALVHALLVLSVAGVLLYDRATLPRAWVQTVGLDPMLPIRGRYVALRVVVDVRGDLSRIPGRPGAPFGRNAWSRLSVVQGRLVADLTYKGAGGGSQSVQSVATPTGERWVLSQPMLFFLPETAVDPTRRAPGEELWAEVSVPEGGAPRPIRLGVRRGGGAIQPLE